MARVTDHADVCDCCLGVIANGDESGCRDYYGHTHPTANLPGAVPGDDSDSRELRCHWTCEACGTDMLPGASSHTVTILGA